MNILTIVTRTAILYGVLLIIVRIMGKRELGQLSPFDFVVAIMVAELAAIPMEDGAIPLRNGIVPIFTLMVLQISLSYLVLKNEWIRKLVNGTPTIVVKNGVIQTTELRKSRCTMNDLLASLREKGIYDFADVEFAVLETSGHLTVIPKSQKRPVTPRDLQLSTPYEGLPTQLIVDGNIHHDNLEEINLDEEWLLSELKKQGVNSVKDVIFASINTYGDLYVAKKE